VPAVYVVVVVSVVVTGSVVVSSVVVVVVCANTSGAANAHATATIVLFSIMSFLLFLFSV
jgi:hypothetical protein